MSRQMKDSGIEWIGEIPETWEVKRVKHGFERKREEAHQEEPVILSLARAGVKVRDIPNNEGQLAESYYHYKKCRYQKLCPGLNRQLLIKAI